MNLWYDKKGKPISTHKANELLRNRKYRIIKQENVGIFWVSTVWLGLNYRFFPITGKKPIIFETMVFCRLNFPHLGRMFYNFKRRIKWNVVEVAIKGKKKKFHPVFLYPVLTKDTSFLKDMPDLRYCTDLDMNRYTSLKEARRGHKEMVKEWKNPTKIIPHLINHLFTEW